MSFGVACKSCGAVLEDAEEFLSTLAARERTIRALNAQLVDKRDMHKHREAVERLAHLWNHLCRSGRARAAAKGKRFDNTAARLNEKFTEPELANAIWGAWFDPIMVNKRKYDDLETIMKSARSVDEYIVRCPSQEAIVARLWLEDGPSDGVWLDVELDEFYEEALTQAEVSESAQLAREIVAGEGRLLEFYRGVHELRLKRDRTQLEAVA